MNWSELCEDKDLQDLPYKIELNRHGQIVMSPTRHKHRYFQCEIAFLLKKLLPHGFVAVECAVDTPEGTKVADVAWSSLDRFRINKERFSCSIAPEICVEVWSPANDWDLMMEKRALYHSKGAVEFWNCDERGILRFFNETGELPRSGMCPEFPTRIED